MKIALFTDFHLGVLTDTDLMINYQKLFIDNFIKKIKEENINNVIFLGDWFETRKSVNVKIANDSHDILKKFKDNNIMLYMIVGNHDMYMKESTEINSVNIYEEINSIKIIKDTTIKILDNKKLMFVPWNCNITENADYIFGHFSFQGAIYSNNMVNEHGMNPNEMTESGPLIFSGHFHRNHDYDYKKGKIITIGSPLQLSWGEINEDKGFYILDLSNGKYEFIKNDNTIPKRHIIKLSDIINKTVNLDIVKGNFIKLIVDIEYDFDKIIKLETLLNKMSPIKPILIDFFKKNEKFNLPELTIDSDKSFNKKDIIKAYVGNIAKDKLDETKLLTIINKLYDETEIKGSERNDE